MVLLAVSDAASSDNPPVWVSTPSVTFQDSTAGTYGLPQHVSDDGSPTYSLNGASTALPTGVTLGPDGTITATTSVAEGTTTGVLVDADDGVNSAVTSPPFSITVTSTGEDAATIIVRADGGGDHTTIQAGINAASPGDIVEVQANTVGGTRYFNEVLTLPSSGEDGNEITVRGRSGDTIVWYNTSDDHILVPSNQSYWLFKRIQFGRDETLNGWEYTTTDANKGRFGVEHRSCVWADNETSSNIVFDNCRFYGGSAYDAVYADKGTSYWGAINCTVTHCGVNVESSAPDFGANGIHFRGERSFIQDCKSEFSGHNGLQMEGTYSVLLRNFCEGDWSFYNTGTGNRTMAVVADVGPAPYGPILSEGNVCRGAKPEAGSGDVSPATKFHSYRGITRRNYIFDNEDQVMQWTPVNANGIASVDYNRFYHNTIYNCGWLVQSTDAELGTAWDNHAIECVWKNNIIDSMGVGRSGDNAHFRWVRSSSGDGAYSNGWRGLVFDNNTLNTAAGDTEEARLIGTGGASRTTVASIESEWSEFTNNQSGAVNFVSVGDRTSDTWSTITGGLELDTLFPGPGLADAVALTNADGTGSSSAILFVDDPLYFAALTDADNWNLGWFSQFGFDVRDDYIEVGGAIAQISSIDYETGRLTLKSSISWSNNDDVFLVDHDGVTTLVDYGASA